MRLAARSIWCALTCRKRLTALVISLCKLNVLNYVTLDSGVFQCASTSISWVGIRSHFWLHLLFCKAVTFFRFCLCCILMTWRRSPNRRSAHFSLMIWRYIAWSSRSVTFWLCISTYQCFMSEVSIIPWLMRSWCHSFVQSKIIQCVTVNALYVGIVEP